MQKNKIKKDVFLSEVAIFGRICVRVAQCPTIVNPFGCIFFGVLKERIKNDILKINCCLWSFIWSHYSIIIKWYLFSCCNWVFITDLSLQKKACFIFFFFFFLFFWDKCQMPTVELLRALHLQKIPFPVAFNYYIW